MRDENSKKTKVFAIYCIFLVMEMKFNIFIMLVFAYCMMLMFFAYMLFDELALMVKENG
jgi:hypothetical protein